MHATHSRYPCCAMAVWVAIRYKARNANFPIWI